MAKKKSNDLEQLLKEKAQLEQDNKLLREQLEAIEAGQESQDSKTVQATRDLNKTIKEQVFNEVKKQRRSRTIVLSIGLILGIGLGLLIAFNWNWIASFHHYLIAGFIIIVLFLGVLIYFFFFFKETILYKVFGVAKASYEEIFSSLLPPAKSVIEKVTPPEVHQKIEPAIKSFEDGGRQLIAYLAYRRTRRFLLGLFVSLILGLFGFVGTVLLLKQNELIKEQSYLAEASRRSSLIFMMSNIMDKVDEELGKDGIKDIPYDSTRRISNITIGRLAALSQAMKPINYLREGSIINKALSPERGQLLLSIANSYFDTIHTYSKLYNSCTFQSADLQGAFFNESYLRKVDLRNADLRNADLRKADLKNVNLKQADLNEANLSEADLSEADLFRANLRKANLSEADLNEADLFLANLNNAGLSQANLRKAILIDADLKNAILVRADLRGADLRGTDLREANLKDADLRGVLLNKAKVFSKNWFNQLEEKEVIGIESLKDSYYINEQKQTDKFTRGKYYLILKK